MFSPREEIASGNMAGQGSDYHLVRNDQHGLTQGMVLAYLVQRPVRARAAAVHMGACMDEAQSFKGKTRLGTL